MADLADAAAAAMDEGLQEGQEFMDKFTRFLERDVRMPLCSLSAAGERDSLAVLKVAAGVVAQEKENEEWKDLQELMEATKPRLYLKLDNVRDFDGDMYRMPSGCRHEHFARTCQFLQTDSLSLSQA